MASGTPSRKNNLVAFGLLRHKLYTYGTARHITAQRGGFIGGTEHSTALLKAYEQS